jgi:surfactin synthase thioesterase subunit
VKNWFIKPRPNPEAKTLLFFFPYAGGGPAVFNRWFAGLGNDIEGCVAHLPGRGSRHLEPAYNRLIPLLETLSQAIQPLLDRPYAFFGHSFGALTAFELTRHLRRCDVPQPIALFVSGCRAPQLPALHPPIHALPHMKFLKALKEFNRISPELLGQPEVMDLLLPAWRADFEALETYVYAAEPPLNCRIVAFGGADDPRVSREPLEAWATQTDSTFRSEYFHGDHFFIDTARESVVASITRELASYAKN